MLGVTYRKIKFDLVNSFFVYLKLFHKDDKELYDKELKFSQLWLFSNRENNNQIIWQRVEKKRGKETISNIPAVRNDLFFYFY